MLRIKRKQEKLIVGDLTFNALYDSPGLSFRPNYSGGSGTGGVSYKVIEGENGGSN